jgi:hypothetical protein
MEMGDKKAFDTLVYKESDTPTARQPGEILSPTPLAHAIATHPTHIQSKGKSQTHTQTNYQMWYGYWLPKENNVLQRNESRHP